MSSDSKVNKILRNAGRGRVERSFKGRAWERRVIRRAREAVSALLQSKGDVVAGGDLLAAAVGMVLLAASALLSERFQEGGESPLRQFLLNGGRRGHESERLLDLLWETSNSDSLLSEGLLGQGLEAFLGVELTEEATASLISFLKSVLEEEDAHDEWTAIRLLGAIYEASLGWKITDAGLGRDVKRVKALGAVYTPSSVVELIVERTLRPLMSGSTTPEALASISVCDPSCGAGAFLFEAMRALEEEAVRKGWAGSERVGRFAWRRRVAVQCLNGVDIDPAAVHLTRLALWLVSSGGEEVVEDLRRSIRTGDAMVGAWRADLNLAEGDEGGPIALRRALDAWPEKFFAPEEAPQTFHWELEFPDRFPPEGCGHEGWAAVVGNPPYVGSRALRHLGPYLRARFPETYTGYNDLSAFFFHRGLELLRPGGRLGFIAPAYWFQNTYGEKLRRYVLTTSRLEEVFDFGSLRVFPGRGVHTAAVILSKAREGQGADGHLVRYRRLGLKEVSGAANGPLEPDARVPQGSLRPSRWVFASSEAEAVLRKAQKEGRPLGELFHVEKGPTSGSNAVFSLSIKDIKKHEIEDELLRPCLKNGEIRRYGLLSPRRWLLYIDDEVDLERYPRVASYLEANRSVLASRNEVRRGRHPWWRLERPRKRSLFEAPAKLVVPYRAPANRFTLDELGCFNDGGDIRVLVPRAGVDRLTMLAALAIANSSLGTLVYRYLGKPKGEMLEFFVKPLASAPFGPPPAHWDSEASTHFSGLLAEEGPTGLSERLLKEDGGEALITPALALLAGRMLTLHRDGMEAETIAETDGAIDKLVARLFGLSPAEQALAVEVAMGAREKGQRMAGDEGKEKSGAEAAFNPGGSGIAPPT